MAPRILIPVPTSFNPDYNARSWPEYAHAVQQAGGEPVALELTEDTRDLEAAAASANGILLPGSGADWDPALYGQQPDPRSAAPDPVRQAADRTLIQAAERTRTPLLCICFGMQSLNVVHGGSLTQHLDEAGATNHRPGRDVVEAHPVLLAPSSRLGRMLHTHTVAAHDGLHLTVNSSHHQAVHTPADTLAVAARSPQDGVIEALEGTDPAHWMFAVQWHPERTYSHSAASRALFASFIQAAGQPHSGRND